MTQPTRKRGRPAVDGAAGVERVTITLTPDERAELRRLGGSPWIRQQIRHRDDAERWRWLRLHAEQLAIGKTALQVRASAAVVVAADGTLDAEVDRLRSA